jgi:hypothetical protein
MRSLRLGREFDAVFVHDAVTYMTSERDLLAAMRTAYAHCKPGGVALFAPDCTKESYRPASRSGGHDDANGRRALRYLEWDWDPVREDTTYHVSMVLVLRDGNKVRVVDDRHTFGVFPRRDWLRLMREAGFRAKASSFRHSESGVLPLFIGIKPGPKARSERASTRRRGPSPAHPTGRRSAAPLRTAPNAAPPRGRRRASHR